MRTNPATVSLNNIPQQVLFQTLENPRRDIERYTLEDLALVLFCTFDSVSQFEFPLFLVRWIRQEEFIGGCMHDRGHINILQTGARGTRYARSNDFAPADSLAHSSVTMKGAPAMAHKNFSVRPMCFAIR